MKNKARNDEAARNCPNNGSQVGGGDERGNTFVLVLLVFALLLGLGFALTTSSDMDFKIAGNHRRMVEAHSAADSGLQDIVGRLNDTSISFQYLKNPVNYVGNYEVNNAVVNPALKPLSYSSPKATVTRLTYGQPLLTATGPPFRVQSSATVGGVTRTVEASISRDIPFDYALWVEGNFTYQSGFQSSGKTYVGGTVTNPAAAPNAVFARSYEYVTNANTFANVTAGSIIQLGSAKPSLTTFVFPVNYLNYAQTNTGSDVCGSSPKRGLYIGAGSVSEDLFRRNANTGPRVYQIDLTLFDFSGPRQNPKVGIKYNGKLLRVHPAVAPTGTTCTSCLNAAGLAQEPYVVIGACTSDCASPAIMDFNGIIYVDGAVHVWGINGGRSVEDRSNLDNQGYLGPNSGAGANDAYNSQNLPNVNKYSNTLLDTGDDGITECPTQADPCPRVKCTAPNVCEYACNDACPAGCTKVACATDTRLTPARRGQSLTIVTASGNNNNIFIDHNIFNAFDPDGNPVRTGLISGNAIETLRETPNTLVINAAMIALGTTSTGVYSDCAGSPNGNLVSTLFGFRSVSMRTQSSNVCANAATNAISTMLPNQWMLTSSSTYRWDLDNDGTIEACEGNGCPSGPYQYFTNTDRLGTDANNAYRFHSRGNLMTVGQVELKAYAANGWNRQLEYDQTLEVYQPPCFPLFKTWSVVAGSYEEVR